MSEDFMERLAHLDRMASAAPQGPLDLRAHQARLGPLAGRVALAPLVRLAPQAPPVTAVPRGLSVPLVRSVRPDPQVIQAQQEQRAQLVRRD